MAKQGKSSKQGKTTFVGICKGIFESLGKRKFEKACKRGLWGIPFPCVSLESRESLSRRQITTTNKGVKTVHRRIPYLKLPPHFVKEISLTLIRNFLILPPSLMCLGGGGGAEAQCWLRGTSLCSNWYPTPGYGPGQVGRCKIDSPRCADCSPAY